jgi:hypothetical protein
VQKHLVPGQLLLLEVALWEALDPPRPVRREPHVVPQKAAHRLSRAGASLDLAAAEVRWQKVHQKKESIPETSFWQLLWRLAPLSPMVRMVAQHYPRKVHLSAQPFQARPLLLLCL